MGEDLSESIHSLRTGSLEALMDQYCGEHISNSEWDWQGMSKAVCDLCNRPREPLFSTQEMNSFNRDQIRDRILKYSEAVYQEKEKEISDAHADMREIERIVLLRSVDSHWMDHIDAMDQLRQGIGLRAYGQTDPVNAYTSEGFDMFDAMVAEIREETVRTLYRVAVKAPPVKREQLVKPIDTPSEDGEATVRRTSRKIGRNDPCPCGSGKKYKNCCGRNE